MTSRDNDSRWNRGSDDDAPARGESPLPTGRDEPISSVAAANNASRQESASPYSDDFEDETDKKQEKRNMYVEEEPEESIAEEEPVSRREEYSAPKRQEPMKKKDEPKEKTVSNSNSGNNSSNNYNNRSSRPKSSSRQHQQRQQPQPDMYRSKSSMYDTRYARFAPKHERNNLDIDEQAERLSAPKRHKERTLPPVDPAAKTYTGAGMTNARVEDMLDRLTRRDKPATDSRRVTPDLIAQKCGIMNSFEWNGRW